MDSCVVQEFGPIRLHCGRGFPANKIEIKRSAWVEQTVTWKRWLLSLDGLACHVCYYTVLAERLMYSVNINLTIQYVSNSADVYSLNYPNSMHVCFHTCFQSYWYHLKCFIQKHGYRSLKYIRYGERLL